MPIRKRAPREKPGHFQDSALEVSFPLGMWERKLNWESSQLPATSAATPGPTRLIIVPAQTRYECNTKQDCWGEVASIEFGGIKLTDAENMAYLGLHGRDDEVLIYQGVGSSITCRLDVRLVP